MQWERDFLTTIAGSPTMKFSDFFLIYKANIMPRLKLNTWRFNEYIIRDCLCQRQAEY